MIEGIELKSNKRMQARQFGRSERYALLKDPHRGYFPANVAMGSYVKDAPAARA